HERRGDRSAGAERVEVRHDAGGLQGKFEDVREHAAAEVKEHELPLAVEFFDSRTSPPQYEHVEREMPEIGVEEDRRDETPDFALQDLGGVIDPELADGRLGERA